VKKGLKQKKTKTFEPKKGLPLLHIFVKPKGPKVCHRVQPILQRQHLDDYG